jgi:pimeloyl-ACP methyl ester carboxylesterase
LRRWLRRIALGLGLLVLALTLASLAYNAATAGRDKPETELYAGPFVRVDGTLLAYRRWGTRGTPIVLISGFIEPSWVWHDVGRLLGRRHRVFAVDLPPFGFSQRRGPYTLARWTDLVRGFARRLGLVRPTIVGHSLGAAVAVSLATQEPHEVAGILLLDGDALPGGGAGAWLPDLLVPPWFTSVYRIVTGSDWIFRRGLRRAWGSGKPPFTDAFIDEWQKPFEVSGTAGALRSMLRYGIQGVPVRVLEAVRVPRIVVWGAEDTVDDVSAGRRTAALLHARFVAVPRAGHLSMLAAPVGVAHAIGGFASR